VIGISADADTTLSSWAREEQFPIVFASDVGGKAGTMYDTFDSKRSQDTRTLFVIDPEGKVALVMRPFHVLAPKDYADLGAVIDKLAPLPADSAR
jgi:peroxiredoxin